MSKQKKVININNRAISTLWNVATAVEYAAGHRRLLKRYLYSHNFIWIPCNMKVEV